MCPRSVEDDTQADVTTICAFILSHLSFAIKSVWNMCFNSIECINV